MAGIFGFFNFEKEGPGVSKDEKKKRGIIRFFELYFRNFWKLITQSALYTLISIPVFTYGLGELGLANVTRAIAREKHSFGASDFFDTIKKNWKKGLLSGIVNTLVTALLIFDMYSFFPREGSGIVQVIFTGIAMFLLFTFTMMQFYVPFMIITFSLRLRDVYKNAFKFVFINLKNNLLIFFSLALFLGACFAIVWFGGAMGYAIVTLVLMFVYPGFRAYLTQYNIFGSIYKYMIEPYYKDRPGEDIEKRLSLGLPVPEEYMPKYEDDTVFDDERILPKDE